MPKSSRSSKNKHSSDALGENEKTAPLSDAQIIRTIMDKSEDTIYFKDKDSKFILNSKAHAQQFDLSDPSELLGKSDADFYPEDFFKKTVMDEQEIMRTGHPIIGRIEKWNRDDGSSVWFSASKYPLFNSSGEIVGTWGISRNITQLKTAEQELECLNAKLELANTRLAELTVLDELSGLYNRRHFDTNLKKTFDLYCRLRDSDKPSFFCLLLIDIDNFKEVNDTYGHAQGDAAIRHVADTLLSCARKSDYCFRFGGDEYAMILPDTDYASGLVLAERLRASLEKNFLLIDGKPLKITMSIGISSFFLQANDQEMLLEADTRLYQCKHTGKNRVC